MVSESLLDALDAYDQKDLQSGCAFKAHVATMLFGMEGAEAGARQLDDWIKKPDYERKNLFIRGLYSNQLEAKAKHEELKKAATDLTAVGIKAMKGTIDFLKKTDSAWDEWARNQGIDKNKGNIAFSKVEKRSCCMFLTLPVLYFGQVWGQLLKVDLSLQFRKNCCLLRWVSWQEN